MLTNRLALLLSLVLGAWTPSLPAGEFAIVPLRVDLDRATRSAEVTVRNDNKAPLRMQVEAMAWRQDADGRDRYESTDGLIYFPRALELAPGESRIVRIGVRAAPVSRSVPLGMFGALTLTFLKMPNPNLPFWTNGWTTTLNVYSQVGLVTLVGLVAKNGILIVEFANKLQEQGQSKIDAVRAAAVTRLRPILMTSVATVFGHLPLTLVTGPGAAARKSIGLVLVAGLAISTAFTLFFVPGIYLLISRDRRGAALAVEEPARYSA